MTDPRVWGMWSNTGGVDPVLARMLHFLRHHWGSDPEDARVLSVLDAVVAGTRVVDALSRRRALFVVDRALRQDLPQSPACLSARRRLGDPRGSGSPGASRQAAGYASSSTAVTRRSMGSGSWTGCDSTVVRGRLDP